MLIKSQNKRGLINLDNVAFIHIVCRQVSRSTEEQLNLPDEVAEQLKNAWCIFAKVNNTPYDVELGRYPTEEACKLVLEKLETAYKNTTTIYTTTTVTPCLPKAVIFEMPPETDFEEAKEDLS